MPVSTRGKASREANDRRASLLHTVAALVFAYLPLSVQAITLPALSKAWKQWAREEQRAKERALEEVESEERPDKIWTGSHYTSLLIYAPLWAAQSSQPPLSDERKRRFQVRAAAHGDVGAVDWVGISNYAYYQKPMCASAALGDACRHHFFGDVFFV